MSRSLIVSASGIRGVVGRGLTPDIAARYGAAFAAHIAAAAPGRGHVLIGRDSRVSGPVLLDAVSAGVRAVGLDVRDLGIVATPTGLLAVEEDEAAIGGLLVTASHNPAPWNGLKLVAREGRFLSPAAGRDVQRTFAGEIEYVDSARMGRRRARAGAVRTHIERILSLPIIDRELIASNAFHVALDCVRGAGGPIMRPLLERLGCRVSGLDLEPDGRFPRPPEPLVENLGKLSERVEEVRADIGFAVDPDVDRLALVDENGRPVGEDWTLALAVELVAAREPAPVVTNLSASRLIQDAADRVGVPLLRTPVAEAHVVARMLEAGSSIGGEGNGGVIYGGLHLTRDAPLAAALILQFLAESGSTLGAAVDERPSYRIVKRTISRDGLGIEEALAAVEAAAPSGAAVDRQDGIRLEWPDGSWIHARPSGTEPIFRIMAEATGEALADERADWVDALVRGAV
ncbi:MAG: phosphoglucosamine mutase [Gemmatimonadales bacterium]|nr:phosphoglucosamine mutase [Gemmatimonadales bacterium]MYG48484.1 phosphoglucosamine mutase [Gemmatimonadales bacterium]MYK01420.1 phosphoglucosamine mutase [Candidatus Palauibacter ramosifaciens]